MDPKQIEEHIKAIHKAQSAKESPTSLLTILKRLQAGVKPTEELLRSTKVGVIVNRLKASDNKDIARLSSEMVSKWRAEVNKQKTSGGSTPKASTTTTNGTTTAMSTTNGTASPAPSEKPVLTVAPDKRTYLTDEVNLKNATGDSTRDPCVGLIYNGLAFMNSTDPSPHILRKASAVEQAVYDLNKHSITPEYKTKIRSLYQNLKNKSNPQLRADVLSGVLKPERFARMSSDEMKSDERKKEEEKIKKENMNNAMVAQEEVSISSSLTCGKCGYKKVSYTQAQTRSADEPMTTFCTCTVCGNRWKFS